MHISTYLTDDEARALYEMTGASNDSAHDFDHVARVTDLAVRIAAAEHADVEVVRLGALLHDVPAPPTAHGGGRSSHHLAAADYARVLLSSRGLGTDRVANVVHCI